MGGQTTGYAVPFRAVFWATTRAADAIAHEMKKAVHGNCVLGAKRRLL
jgi:hypothetical protein